MRVPNDGTMVVVSTERYCELLASEALVQALTSARATSEDYQFHNIADAFFPAPPKEEKPDA